MFRILINKFKDYRFKKRMARQHLMKNFLNMIIYQKIGKGLNIKNIKLNKKN